MQNQTQNQNQNQNQQTIDEDYKQISDVLAAPSLGNPLPEKRRWTIPLPDAKTREDYPNHDGLNGLESNFVEAKAQPDKGKTSESYAQETAKQSGRP